MAVQWLALHIFIAWGLGSIPGQRTNILQVIWHSQKKKKKENYSQEDDRESDVVA